VNRLSHASLVAAIALGAPAMLAAADAPARPPEGAAHAESPSGVCPSMRVVGRFSGVTDDGEQGSSNRKEATSVHCTNFSAADANVVVRLVQWDGIDSWEGTVTMPPGRTFTYSTQNTTIYFDDVIVGGVPGTPAIFQGSGLVLTDGADVLCTPQALDPLNYPPVFIVKLQLDRPRLIFRDGFEGFGDTCEWSATVS